MTKRPHSTRSYSDNPIFGSPLQLPNTQLPTYCDVMRAVDLLKLQHPRDLSLVFGAVTDQVINVWQSASVPVTSRQMIYTKVKRYYDSCFNDVYKRSDDKKHTKQYTDKITKHIAKGRLIFDVAACQCKDYSHCLCTADRKVPVLERHFLLDQRGERTKHIMAIDHAETLRIRKRDKRKAQETARCAREMPCSSSSLPIVPDQPGTSSDDTEDDTEYETVEEEFVPRSTSSPSKQMRVSLSSVAMHADRYGLSDRAVSAVSTSLLRDLGMVDDTCIIDRNKVRRARKTTRLALQSGSVISPIGLFFDGRKDKTVSMVEKDGTQHREQRSEEHISLVSQPGDDYLGHVTPLSATSINITNAIAEKLADVGVELDCLLCIGCDGTAVNTGHKGGVIAQLERMAKFNFQWNICLLHFNELPLRHLFVALDGTTHGPKSFSGPIGISLLSCHELPVVNFQHLGAGRLLPLSDDTANSLSTDQQYLYQICQAITVGTCTTTLANKVPGKIGHSRWLTTASRICRLYVATEAPSHELHQLARYVVDVYAPMWFLVKCQPSCLDGAKHIHQFILHTRYLPDNLREIIDKTVQRNGFFAHHECILLSMLADNDPVLSQLASRRIISAREKVVANSVRIFKPPVINFEATKYHGMVDWATPYGPPPILRKIDNEVLKSRWTFHSSAGHSQTNNEAFTDAMLSIRQIPNHTQSVERCVKNVTEASKCVVGAAARDGWIRCRIAARQALPSVETKRDFTAQDVNNTNH